MRKYLILCALLFYTIVLCKALPWDKPHTSHIPEINPGIDKDSVVRKRHVNDDEEDCDIVFPDVKGKPVKPCGASNFSARGKGRKCVLGVCENAVDYPYEQVEKIKHKLGGYLNLFGNIDGTSILASKGGDAEAIPLCASMVHPIYPKTLKTDKDIEKFIVNVEGLKQGVLFETCQERATCKFSPLFPNTYVSQCTQKYGTRRLMALNEDGNPASDSFVVPSCCVCTVKQIKH